MKLLPLSQGKFAKLDDEDFEKFKGFKWFAHFSKNNQAFYAVRNMRVSEGGERRSLKLHREVMGVTDPKIKVDHKYHDTLDCQKENLRACTHAENARNRSGLDRHNKSGYRGVSWDKVNEQWIAKIHVSGKQIWLGRRQTKEGASVAYRDANKKYFGEFGGLS